MEIALKFRNELQNSFQLAKEDRKYLINILMNINFISKVYESSGSFVTFRIDDKEISKNFRSYLLLNKNIYIKQLTNLGLNESNYFRVALYQNQK